MTHGPSAAYSVGMRDSNERSDASAPLTTYVEIARRAQREWPLWGPNSGGGETVYLVDGRVYWVAYGDAAQTPSGAEEIVCVATPPEFVARYGAYDKVATVVADLKALVV